MPEPHNTDSPAETSSLGSARPSVLHIIDRETGTLESTLSFSASERELPGYVEHVIAGYEGTPWRAELVEGDKAPATATTVTSRVLAAQRARGLQAEDDSTVEPLNNEVDRVARVLMAEWERVEGKAVSASYVATFADMARAVIYDQMTQETDRE